MKCHNSPPYFVPCQGPHPRIGPVEGLPVLQTQGHLNVCSLIAVSPEQYFALSLSFSLDTVSNLNSLSLSRLTNPTRHESFCVLPSEEMSDKCSSKPFHSFRVKFIALDGIT